MSRTKGALAVRSLRDEELDSVSGGMLVLDDVAADAAIHRFLSNSFYNAVTAIGQGLASAARTQ